MNDLDLCLEVAVMSNIASHSPLNIGSDRGLVPKDPQAPIGNDLWESNGE